ncbi:glycosyltransferase family 2 protein [Providencia stuartii]|nr:glycosyltransferase family 2 protein [Providencia stuartii]
MKKYSIIIPGYNIEKYIPSLSIFARDILKNRSDTEFIIIDDGSTDNTYQKAKDEKVFNVFRQYNQGVSSARNAGIEHSKGNYILFLDADDTYDLDILNKLDKHITIDTEMIIFNYDITNIKNKNPKEITYFNKSQVLELFFLKKFNMCICSICFSSEFIRKKNLKFPIGYTFGEDIFFVIKSILATSTKIIYLPEKLFKYKIENSCTVTSCIDQKKIRVIELYSKLLPYTLNTDKKNQLHAHLEYFIQRTYLYLIKLGFKNKLADFNSVIELSKLATVLDNKLLVAPFKFSIIKIIVKISHPAIFLLLGKLRVKK